MYAAVDIGGTKTLVASLDANGVIIEKRRFETPKDYNQFLQLLTDTFASLTHTDFAACTVAVPGTLDRQHGIARALGNLPWTNIPIASDVEAIIHCPTLIENDAKLAGLSEAMLEKQLSKVLYITISTGIGYSLIVNRNIDPNVGDGGGRLLQVEYQDKLVPWESFASGSAIYERYGKLAKDIDDNVTWQAIARNLSLGIIELTAILQPDLIVFGGGVGTSFAKFEKPLAAELSKYVTPMLPLPRLKAAERPEEAVLFGGYDLAVSIYGAAA